MLKVIFCAGVGAFGFGLAQFLPPTAQYGIGILAGVVMCEFISHIKSK